MSLVILYQNLHLLYSNSADRKRSGAPAFFSFLFRNRTPQLPLLTPSPLWSADKNPKERRKFGKRTKGGTQVQFLFFTKRHRTLTLALPTRGAGKAPPFFFFYFFFISLRPPPSSPDEACLLIQVNLGRLGEHTLGGRNARAHNPTHPETHPKPTRTRPDKRKLGSV